MNLTYKDNNIDVSVKNILDDVQSTRSKLSSSETTIDCSDKVRYFKIKCFNSINNIIYSIIIFLDYI